jgi:hypothetical protein
MPDDEATRLVLTDQTRNPAKVLSLGPALDYGQRRSYDAGRIRNRYADPAIPNIEG